MRNDLITKGDAVKAVLDWMDLHKSETIHKQDITDVIMPLPTAEKTGKWMWVQYDANPEIGNWHCSECRFMPSAFNLAKKHLNYCPNCGARMVKEEQDG